MKRFLCVICAFVVLIGCAGCNSFRADDIYVELGEMVVLPDAEQNSEYTVTDESGAPVRVQYGSFIPSAAGTYKVVVASGNKSYEFKVICTDTVAPTVKFNKHLIDVRAGESVSVPLLYADDKSGIAAQTITITDENGNEKILTEDSFVPKSGVYKITATVTDGVGNVATDEVTIISHDEFFDGALSDGELASFNDANYSNTIYLVDGKDCFSAEITGGTLVLSTDKEYGEVYSTIVIPVEGFNFSKAASVKVKLKVNKSTDLVQIRGAENDLIAGAEYYLEADKWYEIDVDPLLLGYGGADKFTLVARANEGLIVTVDGVSYTENKLSADYAGVEVFNNENSLARIFQNTYSTRYFLGTETAIGGGGGSEFSLANKYFYGEAEPVKVLRVQTVERGGGFTYLLQKVEKIENIESISITLSHEGPVSYYNVGVLHDDYKVSSFSQRFAAGEVNERITLTVYADTVKISGTNYEGFANKCQTKITGVWLGTVDGRNVGNVLNVEKIQINYKA